jgi:hypothetical protein
MIFCSSAHMLFCSSAHLLFYTYAILLFCSSDILLICSSDILLICSFTHLLFCSSAHMLICYSALLLIYSSLMQSGCLLLPVLETTQPIFVVPHGCVCVCPLLRYLATASSTFMTSSICCQQVQEQSSKFLQTINNNVERQLVQLI